MCGGGLPSNECPDCGRSNPQPYGYCDGCGASLPRIARPEEGGQPAAHVAGQDSYLEPQPGPTRADSRAGAQSEAPGSPEVSPSLMRRAHGWLARGERRNALLTSGAVAACFGQMAFTLSKRGDGPSGVGVALLVLGMVLFALGPYSPRECGRGRIFGGLIERRVRGNVIVRAVCWGAGLVFAVVIAVRILADASSGLDLVLWVAALLAFGAPFLPVRPQPTAVWSLLRRRWPDLLIVVAITAVFLGLNVRDLGNWEYSAIGDEYSFYNYATHLLDDGISEPFRTDAVDDKHPVLSSAYQAAVMWVFGARNETWRMSSVLAIAMAIPGVYLVGLLLGGRGVAFISTAAFAFSHYMFAYAHTGYSLSQVYAPMAWSLAFFILGLKRGNPLFLYMAGVAAGLGVYTMMVTRAVWAVMLLFVLVVPPLRRRLVDLWPVALGAAATVPFTLLDGGFAVVTVMLAEPVGGYSSDISGPVLERIWANIPTNLLAFNYNTHVHHYVSGALFDSVTAVLAALGVGLSLARVGQERHRLLLIWAAALLIPLGLASPFPTTAVSRLQFAVVPLVLMCGFATVRIWDGLMGSLGGDARRWLGVGLAAVFAVLVLGLNARHFWIESPRHWRLTPEAVAMRVIRSGDCGANVEDMTVVGRGLNALLLPALRSYYPEGGIPRLVYGDAIVEIESSDLDDASCVIFTHPDTPDTRRLQAQLLERYPDRRLDPVQDISGNTTVEVVHLR